MSLGGKGSLIFAVLSLAVFINVTFACIEPFVGCFKDRVKHRILPHRLFSERGLIDWKQQESYFCGLLERCAERAYDLGYTYYGIEYYGECWAGDKDVDLLNKKAVSSYKMLHKGKECNIGRRRAICIYKYVEPEVCGKRSRTTPASNRIVGGYEATPLSWPWMIEMVDDISGMQWCGASLIDPCWVMTAAHCVEGVESSEIGFYAGSHNIVTGNTVEQYRTGQIISHSEYDNETFANDIALIRLDEPFLINDYIHPVCLPDDSTEFPPGTLCTVIGWGLTNFDTDEYPDVLLEVEVELVSLETCNQPESYEGWVHNTSLCAGFPEGEKDACSGDSGGPLMCESGNGTWTQVGIVSWGSGCADPNMYGVYSDVKKLLSFIESVKGSS